MIQLLLRFKASPLLVAKDGFTALHFAAQKESGSQACAYLVAKSAKLLHMKVSKGKKTALHLAVSKGNTDVVQKLLELGADPTTKSGSGQSCLELCPALNTELRNILSEALSKRKGKVHHMEIAVANAEVKYQQSLSSQPPSLSSSSSSFYESDDIGSDSHSRGELRARVQEQPLSADPSTKQEVPSRCDTSSNDFKKRRVVSSSLLSDDDD